MSHIHQIMKVALFTPGMNGRWGLNILWEGSPGTGKSQQVEHSAAAFGLHCTTLVASLREPSDFGGLPIPTKDEKGHTWVHYAAASWAQELARIGRGVVFVDELTTCAPATQAALLRMVLNGALGDFELPKGIRFVAAQNATQEAAGGWDLAPPLANRFGHIHWDAPSAQEWINFMISGGQDGEENSSFDPAAEEHRVMAAWPTAFARAKGLVTAFIHRHPSLLFKMPAVSDSKAGKAWPSPRTWEMATRGVASAMVHGLDEVASDSLLTAFVGAGAAGEFVTYRSNHDLPDPEALLDGREKFKHDARRLDRTMAVLNSCTALAVSSKAQVERVARYFEILLGVAEKSADLTVEPTRVALAQRLHSIKGPNKLASELFRKLEPLLEAAGVKAQ